ncbi:MAG: hypothetical protein U9Q75_09210 [Pseudomonadota bacterium]|nr:hypothetical protein [Pseudomonadota bacterium]
MKRKRHNKQKSRGRKTPHDLSLEQLEKRALQRVESGHFKIAIADLKELLKRERRAEWLEALATAYTGRAAELAGKGMLKEALTIWRNRTEICGKPINDPGYLELLLANDDLTGATEWLQQELPALQQDKNALHAVRCVCAARALGGMQGLVEAWPADDQLRKDLPAAQRALDAYCSGDDGALETALKSLPFRSPFRELKSIFKVLLLLPDASRAAVEPLQKISADSPFYPLALGVRNALSTTPGSAAGGFPANRLLADFNHSLQGWSSETAAAANELPHQQKRANSVQLMRILHKHRQAFGQDFAKEAAMRLAIHAEPDCYRAVVDEYFKTFDIMDTFERGRCMALTYENDMDMSNEVVDQWGDALHSVDLMQTGSADDKSLAKALILRRMAEEIWKCMRYRADESIDYLERSLEFDPDHAESHILLVQRYRDQKRLKDARRVAALAESRWPEDPRVLIESAHNAIAGDAFHKAARIARNVLQFDPVNVEIKQLLFDAHIAHARKKIYDDTLKLADKELLQAVEWASADSNRGHIELLRGITAFKQGDKSAASSLIASACERLGVLRGRLMLAIEATSFSLKPAALRRISGIKKQPEKYLSADIMAIVPHIEAALLNAPEQVIDAAVDFIPALKQGASLDYKESELIRLCELWRRHDCFRSELLEPYAAAGEHRWPDLLIFDFFLVEATRTLNRPLSDENEDEMYNLLEDARILGDSRTAALIDQVLQESLQLQRLGYQSDAAAEPAPAAPPIPEVKQPPLPATRSKPQAEPFAASDLEPTPRQFNLFDDDPFSEMSAPLPVMDEFIKGVFANGLPPEFEELIDLFGETQLQELMKTVLSGEAPPEEFEEFFDDFEPLSGNRK